MVDKPLDELVNEFAKQVAAQNDATRNRDPRTANKHAKRVNALFGKLCAHGDAGRDALAALFEHERTDVSVMTAAFLLRHKTNEAQAVLEEAAKGRGFIAFAAQQALERWKDGTWALDPG